MKILITGGAGFMGSNFIHYIFKKYPDYKIVNLDKLSYAGNLDNLKDIESDPRHQLIKGDICDEKLVEELAKDVDVIVNYAAETHVDRSIMDPSAFVKTDVLGTYNLLEAAKKFNHQRYIQISTDEVFGSIKTGKFTEESPFKPNSPYAASKAGADLLCRSYVVTYKMPVIVTHSCNYFGPYHYPEKFIPIAITNLLEGKKVPVYGKGINIREWIYTEDHCRAIDLVLHKGIPGEVYNISTEDEWKNIDVIKLILKIMGKEESLIEFVKDRPGHDLRYSIDASKIKNELGWEPEYKFEDALKETIEWFKKNKQWWENIVNSSDYKEYYEKQYGVL